MNQINHFLLKLFNNHFDNKYLRYFISFLFTVGLFNSVREIYRKTLAKGQLSYEGYDWNKNLEYISILRESFEKKVLPWFTVNSYQGSHSFLANPEVTWSPLTPFILFFETPGSFDLYQTLFMMLIGFLGLLFIKKKQNLNWLSFSVLCFFFFLNGQIIARLWSGHLMWHGYFLLPFLFYFFDQLSKSPKSLVRDDFIFSLLMAGTIYLGSLHIALILTLFYLFFAAQNRFQIKKILITFISLGALTAVRVIPAFFEFLGKRSDGNFLLPYRTFTQLLEGILIPHGPKFQNHWGGEWSEYNFYIGILGVLFVTFFIWKSKEKSQIARYTIAYSLLLLFAVGTLYKYVHTLHIPVFSGIRVTSRFITIPLVFLMFQAIKSFQDYQLREPIFQKTVWAWFIAFILFKEDLIGHSKLYVLPKTSTQVDFINNGLSLSHDSYGTIFTIGLVITGIGIVLNIFFIRKLNQTSAG